MKKGLKIPTRRVKCDDCTINVGRVIEGTRIVEEGTPHRVHEGEWVDIVPVGSLSTYIALDKLSKGLTNPDQNGMASSMISLCETLASRITDWNWTDIYGERLPKPTPEVVQGLAEDEIIYLITAVQGESVVERKNASRRSQAKSSTAKRPQNTAS